MPITTNQFYAEKYDDPDHFAHVLDHLFRPALEQAGYNAIPPTVTGPELIHAEIIKNLEQADLVLCDLSSLNANVFFELGIRTSLDRSVVLVKDDQTTVIPFDINAINVLTYDSSLTPWVLTKEIDRLVIHLNEAAQGTGRGNAMWRYFGLTKRAEPSEGSSNPIEAKLDILLGEFRNWQSRDYTETLGQLNFKRNITSRFSNDLASIMKIAGEGDNYAFWFDKTNSAVVSLRSHVSAAWRDQIRALANNYGIELIINTI